MDITFVRGDTHIIALDVTDADGLAYTPQAGDTLTMTVRTGCNTGEIAFQKLSGTEDVKEVTGGWEITIQPEDTADLAYVQYVYDIEVNLDGYVQTIVPMAFLTLGVEVTYI